jgi:hypothetical protein
MGTRIEQRRRASSRAAPLDPVPCRIEAADRRLSRPVLDRRGALFLSRLATVPPTRHRRLAPGCILPIAIRWNLPGGDPRPTRRWCPRKKRGCRPLAGSGLGAKDLWPPADPLRSASGSRVADLLLFRPPPGFWGRCEPRRAEGAQPGSRNARRTSCCVSVVLSAPNAPRLTLRSPTPTQSRFSRTMLDSAFSTVLHCWMVCSRRSYTSFQRITSTGSGAPAKIASTALS